jgi:ketosteroid isomerase-like protein
VATAVNEEAVEANRRCALNAYDHYNNARFDAFSACFADDVTSFRPEMAPKHPKFIAVLNRDDFVCQQRVLRSQTGPVNVLEVYADRGVVAVVIQFSDGELASNTLQFSGNGLIERSFVRRGETRPRYTSLSSVEQPAGLPCRRNVQAVPQDSASQRPAVDLNVASWQTMQTSG